MISLIESDKKSPQLRWDPERKKYIGWRVDVRSGQKRMRPTFPTKKQAEDFVAQLRTKKIYEKVGLKPVNANIGNVRISSLFDARLKLLRAKTTNKKRLRLA